jgi:DivIVA domain-containing protein
MADNPRRPSTAARLTPEEITNRGFASAFRGVSETEVRNFLRRVADDLRAMRGREDDLNREIERLQEQLANPPPVTEQQLLDALGEETARVLRSAQDAAEEIRKRAEARAQELVREAQDSAGKVREEADRVALARSEAAAQRATELQEQTEARVTELREAADRELTELREAVTREVENIRAHAEEAATTSREEAKIESLALVDEARTVRERLLADLARRRSLLQAQVDELRSGRDRLLDAYRVVKHTLSDATDALAQVEARANAELAGPAPRVALPPVEGELEMLHAGGEPEDDVEDAVEIEGGAEAVVVVGDAGDADSGAAVDALFARLRASHTADPPAAVALEEPTGAPATEPGPEAAATEEEPGLTTPGGGAPPEAAASPSGADEGGEPGRQSDAADDDGPTGDDALRAARAEVLGPVTHDLNRRAKRALQDQQNEVLDRIRTVKGRIEAEKVLPAADEMGSAWVKVLREPLTAAYAGAQVSIAGPERKGSEVPEELVEELARDMVDPWRQRLVAAIDAAGEDTDSITQRLGSRYREYRGKQLENRLGDALASAWARGTFDAAPDGARLRWIPAAVGRCPDCDDNALEPTARTEAFPTGQLYPPAHPGCRCFLAVAT